MSFWSPRYTSTGFGSELAPFFRLLDEGLSDYNRLANKPSPVRAFAPRFDVKEHKDSYTLDGELPGIEQKNIEIEFTDPHTLVIKGRTESSYTSGVPGAEDSDVIGTIEASPADDAASTSSGKSAHQPTVEDEDAPAQPSTEVAPTPAANEEITKPAAPQSKSWISERSVGEFHRSFSFPSRVDQDAVKASLKNGILSIVVPKATAPESRRISIE